MNKEASDRRLKILTPSEQQYIYEKPNFSAGEQRTHFRLSQYEKDIVAKKLKGNHSKLYFILQLGYFRFSFRFFKIDLSDVSDDIAYVAKKHFPEIPIEELIIECDKKTKENHYAIILELFSYRFPSTQDRTSLYEKAKTVVLIDANPKYIFKELVRLAIDKKIVLPSYTGMRNIVSKAILVQENKLFEQLESFMNEELKQKIDSLLSKESKSRYQLTLIKTPAQNFTYKYAKIEREKRDELEPIFVKAKEILLKLKISNLSIKYFAKIVDRYSIFQLKRFEQRKRCFYILCFVYYRYLKVNDALVKTFLHLISKYKGEVKEAVKEQISQMRIENSQNLKKGAQVFRVLTNNAIPDSQVRATAFDILAEKKINKLADYMQKSGIDFEEFRWVEYDKKSDKIRKNLRHIFKSLDLTTNEKKSNTTLFEAVSYLKTHLLTNRHKMKDPPKGFIPNYLSKYIYYTPDNTVEKVINEYRYEVLIYRMLKNRIDSSDIFVSDSMEYRSLENDLIEIKYFTENMDSICNGLGVPFLTGNFEEMFREQLKILDGLIHEVNQNILNNKNPYFKFTTDNHKGKWHLDYKGVENKEVNNPIFKKIPKIDLANLIWLT
jgi:hypothetical protein